MDTERELVGLNGAAQILGVSAVTVDRLVKAGQLTPTVVADNRWRLYSRSDVEALARIRAAKKAS